MELNSSINKLKDMINIHFVKLNDILNQINQINQISIIPFEIVESEIVIVCHCSKEYENKHDPLFYIDTKNKNIIKELGDDVKYVDVNPSCVNNKWENIGDESKMYIWGINCPINLSYSKIFSHKIFSHIIDDILKNSLRVLKKNGKVLFPFFLDNSNDLI